MQWLLKGWALMLLIYLILDQIPSSVLQASVEVGRACIAKEYRNIQALLLLWQGLANYLIFSNNQYFFGCASLLTQCS